MITRYNVKYGDHYQLNYNHHHELIDIEVWERGYYATYRKVTLDFIKSEVEKLLGSELIDYYIERNNYQLSKFDDNHELWYRFIEAPCNHIECDIDLHEDILKYLNHNHNGYEPVLQCFRKNDKLLSFSTANKNDLSTLYSLFKGRPDLSQLYSIPEPNKRGFDSGKESVFYINEILDEGTIKGYKFGISNGDGKSRLYNQNRGSKYTINKKHNWVLDGKVARSIENIIKSQHKKAFTKEELPDGYTETFLPYAYEAVLELVEAITKFTGE